ncbi:PrsW family intramembrane metalloprotease [Streptomyces sp. V4I2]|uniref:PrsW family intramembrane metalloprotease n=1 Tax=Streptomyces sp. V4I2 TaxID=3042280 RepID=UPI0027D91EFF|nr:PrsW family glutamic-type intramembrane protease [Streptomyces sp. V4I2]
MRCVLVIAGLMSAAYGVEMLIDLARPRIDDSDPAIGLFSPLVPTLPRAVLWSVVAGWAVVLLAGVTLAVQRVAVKDPGLRQARTRGAQLVVLAALLLPFTLFPAWTMVDNVSALLVCVPSTGFALWAVHRMQRYRRMPAWLLLATFAWGVFVACGFGSSMNIWYMDYAPYYFGDAGNVLEIRHQVMTGAFFNAGVFEELGKGAGVAIVCVLFRRHVDGVVSGTVLGAAAGLGFNFAESVEYMGAATASPEFQYWMRQSVGLMAAHTAFAAIFGAGLGLARQLDDARSRRIAVVCGFVAASGTHAASNVMFRWVGQVTQGLPLDPDIDTLLLQPLVLIVFQGPVVALYVMMLRRGIREQAAGLAQALAAEAQSGNGAITDTEAPVLLSPVRRLWLRITVLRRYGFTAYRKLTALHAAQLDLATHLWHESRRQADRRAPDGPTLRLRILALKDHQVGPALQQRPAEALT